MMKQPDFDQQAQVWDEIIKVCQFYEDQHGFKRDTVLHGIWKAIFTLNFSRPDKKLIRTFNERRHFLLFACQDAQRQFDQLPSYKTQRLAEEKYGKDMLPLRNAKNFNETPEN